MVTRLTGYQITSFSRLIILLSPAAIATSLIEASKHKSTYWVKGSRVLAPFYEPHLLQKVHIFEHVLLVLGACRRGLCSSLSKLNSKICFEAVT